MTHSCLHDALPISVWHGTSRWAIKIKGGIMQLQLRKAASLGILLVILTTLSGCIFVPGLRVSASGDHSRANTPYRVIEVTPQRSEERRVGKECFSTCRYRWSPYH